jgi:excisionase family DNA binding protein
MAGTPINEGLDGSPLVDRAEAAAYLGVSRQTIRRLQHGGQLSLVHIGGCVRVKLRELYALAESGTKETQDVHSG